MAKVSTIYDVRIKYHLDSKAASKGLTAFNKKVKALSRSFTSMNKKTKSITRDVNRLGRAGSKSMKNIDRQARRAALSLNKVSRSAKKANRNAKGGGGGGRIGGKGGSGGLGRVVGMAAGFFGAGAILKHTIGFNRELDTTKKSLATVIQLMDKDTSTRAQGLAKSSILMSQLREDAKQSAGTFQDMTNFAKQVAPPLLAAGASMEQLRELTKGAVVASSAFGINADVAALDIRQALGKGLNKRDPFGSMLLDSIKMTTDEFNKLDKSTRLVTLQKAFDQPAIKAAAAEYQNSFEGVFSTFKSTLQEFGGKVGKGLFARMNIELKKANKWLSANGDVVAKFAEDLADGMVTAFDAAKGIFGFLFEHKDLLLTMAKAFLITKGAGVLAGPFLSFNTKLGDSTGKLGKFAGGLGGALQAFGTGYAIGTAFDDLTGASDKLSDAFDNLINGSNAYAKGVHYSTAGIDTSTPEGRAMAKEKKAMAIRAEGEKRAATARKGRKGAWGMDPEAFLSPAQKAKAADDRERKARAKYKGTLNEATSLEAGAKNIREVDAMGKILNTTNVKKIEEARMKVISVGIVGLLSGMMPDNKYDMMKDAANPFSMTNPDGAYFGPAKASDDGKPKDKKNNVKIGKIVMQIESNDPDRLAMGMEGLFSDLAKNGAQAANSLREG